MTAWILYLCSGALCDAAIPFRTQAECERAVIEVQATTRRRAVCMPA